MEWPKGFSLPEGWAFEGVVSVEPAVGLVVEEACVTVGVWESGVVGREGADDGAGALDCIDVREGSAAEEVLP